MAERIVFGAGPVVLSPARVPFRTRLARLLADRIGVPVEIVSVRTYDELLELVAQQRADILWLPPAVYVRAAVRYGVEVLLAGVRARVPRFRGALFTANHRTTVNTPDDLHGMRVAWVDGNSCAGFLFPMLALRERGLAPDALFVAQTMMLDHRNVARAVTFGEADVGATFVATDPKTDRVIQAGWTLEVDFDVMKPVLVTAPIPADAVCAGLHVDPVLRDRAAQALASLHIDPEGAETLLGLFGVDKFSSTTADAYAVVQRALDAADRGGVPADR